MSGPLSADILNSITSLEDIRLGSNLFSGSLPAITSTTVRRLWLNDNNFVGSIPDSYSGLTSIRALRLQSNSLTGTIPDLFPRQLQSLHTLLLNNNQLSGRLSDDFNTLAALNILDVHNNIFTGTIPATMALTDMAYFAINKFTGSFPSKYCTTGQSSHDCTLECTCSSNICDTCVQAPSASPTLSPSENPSYKPTMHPSKIPSSKQTHFFLW